MQPRPKTTVMHPLEPGSTIGIFGGGQLGRMLASAATELGFRTHIFCPEGEAPATEISHGSTRAAYDDLDAVRNFASSCDRITYEFENISLSAANAASAVRVLAPGSRALEVSQDRLVEKRFVEACGFHVAPYAPVNSSEELEDAIDRIGAPGILKSCRFGYDGKGQSRVTHDSDPAEVWTEMSEVPSVYEGFVDFAFEFSVVAARSSAGEFAAYDIGRNEHGGGILLKCQVPSPLPEEEGARAKEIARTIADELGYVGVIAVEFFYDRNAEDPLIVNEFAPRVHNSGHWTMDACAHSQFENHIRAVAGWPLGATERHSDAEMTNLIGSQAHDWLGWASRPASAIHLYGKKDARPGRKMGHVTTLLPHTSSE